MTRKEENFNRKTIEELREVVAEDIWGTIADEMLPMYPEDQDEKDIDRVKNGLKKAIKLIEKAEKGKGTVYGSVSCISSGIEKLKDALDSFKDEYLEDDYEVDERVLYDVQRAECLVGTLDLACGLDE